MEGKGQNITVAMCTFNGGEYLSAQIDSILNQTIPPCELIIAMMAVPITR